MTKLLLAATALVALAAPVHAADMRMPVKAPPPVVVAAYNWSGFYLGVHGGYAWGKVSGIYDNNDVVPTDLGRHKDNTGIFGGQIGYNFQNGNFVFGVEVDASKGFNKSTVLGNPGATPDTTSELDWLFSARGRIGMAVGSRGEWLPFLTAGWGWTRHEFGVTTATGGGPLGTINVNSSGFVGGGGIEYGISPWASLRIEGLHYANSKTRNIADGELNDSDTGDFVRYRGVTVVRGALNIRFGGTR